MRTIKHPDITNIELTDIMYALSDPVRLEIVRKLAAEKILTCHALNCDRPKSSMSHHFKILRDAGLLETHPQGNEHHNSLRMAELEKKFPGLMRNILKLI